MRWLLDTNIVSELARPRPNDQVLSWISAQQRDDLAISTVSLAEIRFGIATLSDETRRQHFSLWLEETIRPMFLDRTLDISEDVLVSWHVLSERARKRRQTLPSADSLIAATAHQAGLSICTRDLKPYLACGLPTLNPWTGERFNGA